MISICANVQPSLSPQQKLDHIEGLEDTPDKGKKKKKGQLSKSDVSSDSDAYSGTPGEQMSDSGVSSVDVDMDKDLPMSSKTKIKAKGNNKPGRMDERIPSDGDPGPTFIGPRIARP